MDDKPKLKALSTLGIDSKKWAKIALGSFDDQVQAIVKGLKKR